MAGHTHDGIDWTTWLHRLREADAVAAGARRALARRLVGPQTRMVVDVGSGAGGMGVAFVDALSGSGGTVVLVDSVPELLDAAAAQVTAAAGPLVEMQAVRADAASDELLNTVPRADLVFASFVVHHLPDQQRGLDRLAALVSPGGRLAIVESGLEQRFLPWDVGVGEPGLQGRLTAAHGKWFCARAGMEGAVRLPVGWGRALRDAGLTEVSSFQLPDRRARADRSGPSRGRAVALRAAGGGRPLDRRGRPARRRPAPRTGRSVLRRRSRRRVPAGGPHGARRHGRRSASPCVTFR
ncbi:MAG TPA: class I SAM-dependent methyltransferase [Pseudonocardiaceae bacterium]|nr:class I SAM-dependent methyltransferase [Pseudonocardiaceae bacterium]